MNGNKLTQHIEAMHRHVAMLQQRFNTLPWKQDHQTDIELLAEALEELWTALEELRVVEEDLWVTQEELYIQNEELHQRNLQLAIAHQGIEVQRQRYQDLFEFAPDGYLVTNARGTIQEANYPAAMLLNCPHKFLVDKQLIAFVAKEARKNFQLKLTRLCQRVSPVQEWEMFLQPARGDPFDAVLKVAAVRDKEGKAVMIRWLLRDITARKRAEEAILRAKLAEAAKQQLEREVIERKRIEAELWRHAFRDPLTGLPNRSLFMDRLQHVLEYAKRHKDYLFAILFLDLDRFKVINDSLGHTLGDQLLVTVAGKLQACLRSIDTAARLGGDEFTILLEDIKDISDVIRVSQRIQAELALPLNLGGQEVLITASIGIALSTTGYDQPEDMLRDADIAMYQAKAHGPAGYEIFNTELHTRAVARLQMETELRRAIERREFQIYYQPIVSLEAGCIFGFEALVRWQHPSRGLLLPGEFISIAEETGLSLLIDQWVLWEACRQTQQWQVQFPQNLPLTISINLCSSQFRQPKLTKHIHQALQETGLNAHSLKLEITESVILESSRPPPTLLSELQALDVELCIDDFGTGYSSLSRLHCLPIHLLKIDRSFIGRMGIDQVSNSPASSPIVEAIVTLAQKLGLAVTAEGVESVEQLAQLRALKCDYGQGYFFSRPLNAQAAEALIASKPQW